jgi:hypothetical protein
LVNGALGAVMARTHTESDLSPGTTLCTSAACIKERAARDAGLKFLSLDIAITEAMPIVILPFPE